MARVVPTILARSPEDFAARLERIAGLSTSVHIDISDGTLADSITPQLSQVYAPDGVAIELHLMLDHPETEVEAILSLQPRLVTVHFEAEGNRTGLFGELRACGVRIGLAVTPETAIEQVAPLLGGIDHLLIFTGQLGHNGGEFRADCLDKIGQARAINPELEIGVDGGIDQYTAGRALEAGADVLYSGSFIHDAADPEMAYVALEELART